MAVKEGLPATDFSKMNRDYIRNVAEGETVKDGLPATDFSRMNREYIKAVVEEAGGGGGGGGDESDFSVAEIAVKFNVPEGFSITGAENEYVQFSYDGAKYNGNDVMYSTRMSAYPIDGICTFNVIMYKNKAYFATPFPLYDIEGYDLVMDYDSEVCTGGIAYDSELETFVVTGDGTYEINLTAEPI